jgi:hypothetical protein
MLKQAKKHPAEGTISEKGLTNALTKMNMTRSHNFKVAFFTLLALISSANQVSSFAGFSTKRQRSSSWGERHQSLESRFEGSDDMEWYAQRNNTNTRRALLFSAGGLLSSLNGGADQALATGLFQKNSPYYAVEARSDIIEEVRKEQVDTPISTLSSEYALLRVLPVKNPVFRALEGFIESLSALQIKGTKY